MRKILLFSALTIISLILSCGNEQQTKVTSQAGKTYKPTTQTSLYIDIPETKAAKGDSLCINVTVRDFKKIVSIQHSVNWDNKILNFLELGNFNLASLSHGSFGLTNVKTGKYGISWYDPSLKGITLEDGESIYQLCFEVIGEPGTESPVRISSDPVMIEVSNAAERVLGIPSGKGKVVVN